MNDERKFTIVIPTRDRGDTLVHTIACALSQDYTNFEVLVSDNASNDNTRELVSGIDDRRIRYVNTGKRLSMSHNWEFALSHVNDGWVTVLGDDDAILPGSLSVANRIVAETDTRAIRSNGSNYLWPSLTNGRYGSLTMSLGSGYRTLASKTALAAVMKGERHYNTLPMLYNGGFVHTSLIDKAKSITKDFFRSMTPDVYSAIVFSTLTEEYIYSDEPLAINGASHHSGGTAGFEKTPRKRSYDPAIKFWSEDNIPFHKDLPLLPDNRPVRSIQAIVYEAYLQASAFHHGEPAWITATQQLEAILRNAEPHTEEVFHWGKAFAEQNSIDFEQALHRAQSKAQLMNGGIRRVNSRAQSLFRNFTIHGNPLTPLRNVHEASIVFSTLKRIRPGYSKRLTNIYDRLTGSMSAGRNS